MINYYEVAKAAKILRAVNHKLRQNIIALIQKQDKGRITVTEIYVLLRLEQSVASQHLAILRKAGVVTTQREGKFIYYSVNEAKLKNIEAQALELTK